MNNTESTAVRTVNCVGQDLDTYILDKFSVSHFDNSSPQMLVTTLLLRCDILFQDGIHYLYDTVLKRKSNSSLIRTMPGRMIKTHLDILLSCDGLQDTSLSVQKLYSHNVA